MFHGPVLVSSGEVRLSRERRHCVQRGNKFIRIPYRETEFLARPCLQSNWTRHWSEVANYMSGPEPRVIHEGSLITVHVHTQSERLIRHESH
jgi:hypothetical protein